MRILTLTPWYPNPENNGTGIFVKEQAFAIAKYGKNDVFIIAPFPTKKFTQISIQKSNFDEGSLTEILVPYKTERTIFDKFLKRKDAIKRGFKEIKIKPDIFHVHEYQMVSIAKSLISNIPIILTEHSSTLSSNLGIKRYLARTAFKNANTVIAVSQYQKDRILSINPNTNLTVVNNFVSDDFLNAKKVVRSDKLVKIISVGSLIEKKGFKILIQAFSKLEKNFTLTIVGDGPQKDELKLFVKNLELEDRIFFTGALDRKNVLKQLTESDIFVSASKIETFGIAILEALAVGLPVVTYENGGVSDFMNDFCGIVISDYTSEAFADGIKNLVKNINTYEPEKIKDHIFGNFSANIFSQKINQIYRRYVKDEGI